MKGTKPTYAEAMQAKETVLQLLTGDGIHDAGVGLTPTENGLAVSVHLSCDLPHDEI